MKTDTKQVAETIRADAEKYAAQFHHDGDREFEELIAKDVAALRAVADLVEHGDMRAAYRRWSRLDTVVREALSQRAWRALTGGNAVGHTRHDR
jgi:hypothetical protein